MGRLSNPALCLYTSTRAEELFTHVERLWQVDIVPYRSEKSVTRSKQDHQAIALLENKTVRTMVDGALRYATPLLRHDHMPLLQAPKESVMPLLRSTERRLLKENSRAEAYKTEMQKLIDAGAVKEVSEEKPSKESWYIPHHLVTHNGKNRIVFNCLQSVGSSEEAKSLVDRLRSILATGGFGLRQRTCPGCQRWRGQPSVPKMSNLPLARLRLFKPAFYSTGVDCFGPMQVKIGRRHEKRWGIIFKCMTMRAVHLELLSSLDTDAFLMALRRFISRRGTPAELWLDQGTNFRGGERELKEAFSNMADDLRQHLAKRQIKFLFNPPGSPHFGGVWEREIRSVKSALRVCVSSQPIHEEVLLTVLLEVESILNSTPLGYVSTDIADVDPVTPNSLLMGRPDGSLPQVVYPKSENLSRRRWQHSQNLADQFWVRFIKEYLPNLQTRLKWQSSSPELLKETVVMLVDPQMPRALWPVGYVVKTHRSEDGCIRSADVNIKGHLYTRPVARMVVLPSLPSGEDQPTTKQTPSNN
ncbi:uncharacterized protein [Nothobranchius furzeri]|uniref:uncharacterized protein n=1 Tax=Nothobranchius furzeri TaxID=105023 RepID=UPI0039048D3E